MPTQMLNYLGGLNKSTSYGTTPNNQLSTIDNLRFSGANLAWIGSTYRIAQIPASGVFASGIFYPPGISTPNMFFVVNDSANSKILASTLNTSAMTFSDITGAASIVNGGMFEMINGILFYAAGTNGLYQWNGTGNISAVGGSSPANANILKVANNFLFSAYDQDVTGTVYWSNVATY